MLMAGTLPQRSHNRFSRLTKKRGVYYFRRRLRERDSGEVAVSLRTRKYREAEHLAASLDEVFGACVLTMSSRAELTRVLQNHLQQLIAAYDDHRVAATPGKPLYTTLPAGDVDTDPVDADLEVLSDLVTDARERYARRDFTRVNRAVDVLMAEHKFPADLRNDLALGLIAAEIKALETAQERLLGRDIDHHFTPVALSPDVPPPAPPPQHMGPKFSDFVEDYVAFARSDKGWRGQTEAQSRKSFELFVELCGDKPVEQYTRRDTGHFEGSLRKLPALYGHGREWKGLTIAQVIEKATGQEVPRLSRKTLRRHLSAVGGLFSRAKVVGLYEGENPAHGFGTSKKERASDARSMWDVERLQKLFSSPVWTGSQKVQRAKAGPHVIRDEKFWLPLLGLFHGNRLEEFAQLQKADIQQQAGIRFFDIRRGEGKQLKNAQSERRVPIHPELIRIGFLSYIETLPDDPKAIVFPLLKRGGPDGKLGYYFTKWWTTYRRAIGVYAPKIDYHSFRHNVTTKLFQADVASTLVDQLTGHEGKGTSAQVYFKGATLQALHEAISKVQWPELDFSALYLTAGHPEPVK